MSDTGVRKELDLNRKVKVKNLGNIPCYVKTSLREVMIPRNGEALIEAGEIMQRFYNNDINFVGTDGQGSHACLYVMDKDVRIEMGFETEDGKTVQLKSDTQSIIDIFNIEKEEVFYETLKSRVVTLIERQMLQEIITSGKVNQYNLVTIAQKFLANEQVEFPKKTVGRTRKS